MRTHDPVSGLLLALFSLVILSSCNHYADVSDDPRYSHTVKRELRTKRALELSVFDFPYTSYRDRHEIAKKIHVSPKLGSIGRNHTVYFERAVSDRGYNKTGLHYLEGHTTFNGETIPIYYSLDFPGNQDKFLGNYYKDFTVKTGIPSPKD